MEGPGVLVRACLVSSHRIVFELAYVRMKVIERKLGSPTILSAGMKWDKLVG